MASSWHTCPTCGRSSPSPSLQTTTEGELDSPFDNRCWKGYGIVLYPNSVAENVEYTKSMAKDAVAFYNFCRIMEPSEYILVDLIEAKATQPDGLGKGLHLTIKFTAKLDEPDAPLITLVAKVFDGSIETANSVVVLEDTRVE
ncbi:hypothetical protein ACP275_14G201100 [Erythranthe tilingii]